MVELLALGPLELWHHDQRFALGSVKERCVLAVLVHARGEPVTVDVLMDRVWGDEMPRTAQDTLHSYLSRLRGRLRRAVGGMAQVERLSLGVYRLRVDPDHVDLLRFQQLRKDAGAAAERGETGPAIGLLREAEALWRGEPLLEFSSAWATSARARLIEDHRRVREERIRLQLESGEHTDLVGELYDLAAETPFAQKVIGSLMLALYRSGRPDEALAAYRTTRQRLSEHQGIDPGAELQQLHLRILEQDLTLMATDRGTVQAAGPTGGRNSLPRDTREFIGRTSELRILLAESQSESGSGAGSGPDGSKTTALPLTVIHGMPGIGKTALAVHAAHRLCASYPDGQFYVDLHAYSGQPPFDPAEALAVLLRTAGSPGDPKGGLDERAARWREWTARHRALVVLDNARDAAQVKPLLPGTPSCRVIVTSRHRLAGLDGATPVLVDVLSRTEAATLFSRIAGAIRRSDNPKAMGRVVEACGCHPLAVQLLASHFRHRDSWDLQHLLDRLAQAADPLDEFDDAVASAFQLTYAELSDPAQCLFRRLALHPGPDITFGAATALAGPEVGGAAPIRRSVAELMDCHLLAEPVRDRYRLHDLARAFGRQVGTRAEPEPVRRAALDRLLAYYLTTAHRADRLLHPHRRTLSPPPERVSPTPSEFAGKDEASVWLTVERANLLAVARTAADTSSGDAVFFPHVLASSLKLWGAWHIAAELYGTAAAALRATDGGSRAALARTLVERADVLAQKDHDEALRCATEALSLFRELTDPHGCADALLQSGRARLAAGHSDKALHLLDQGLERYRALDDRYGEAECLNVQCVALGFAGRYGEALRRVRTVLAIHEELGDLHGQIQAHNNMGYVFRLQARYEDARISYERCLALVRQSGGRQQFAILDTNLGELYQATGQTARALTCFRRALGSHRANSDALGETNALISMGTAYAETAHWDDALRHYGMAEEVARSIDNAYERQRALLGIADAHRESGRCDEALKVYGTALDVTQSIGFPLGSAHALAGLARTALRTGGVERARDYGRQAIALYRRLEDDSAAESLKRLLGSAGVTT